MAYISKINRRQLRDQANAAKNRRELIAAQFSRRDLMKMGLLTSAGLLIPKRGLSARAQDALSSFGQTGQCTSPATTPFVDLLPIMPVKQSVPSLNPAPTECPNTAAGESRTRCHQAFTQLPPQRLYQVVQQTANVTVSPDLPVQTMWGFDAIVPGPTYVSNYGVPILVRNVNSLPINNGGFGLPSVSTHLHNGHTPSESDGFPCDFFEIGHFYDQHYPNVLAGFASDHQPNGDINEALSTLWYHDHRVDFTSQNVYKGLAGFFLLFNQFDTGNESTGFHLPTFPDFDIPMMFADKCFDQAGLLAFDLFNLDGILGDKFLVNGKIQPVLHVSPRRYRFRWLNSGPSRFYQIFLTRLDSSTTNQFWQISNDGNLLPHPIQISSVKLGVAERADVIIDFAPFAGRTLYLENRLVQRNGRGPDCELSQRGQGNLLLQIVVDLPPVADNSVDPATNPTFYTLPDKTAQPRVTRTFNFELTQNGQWTINNQFMDCNTIRFTVQQNTVERWVLRNTQTDRPAWTHPIHIHFEEYQIFSGNNQFCFNEPPTSVNVSRKDVIRLNPNTQVTLFFRFRDFLGRYPMHCHNTIHEDHAMMLRWEIGTTGDLNQNP